MSLLSFASNALMQRPSVATLVVMQLTRVATACCLYVAAKLGRMPWWVDVRGRM